MQSLRGRKVHAFRPLFSHLSQMSCYLSSADALNALATYWEASANRGMRSAESFLTRALFLAERAESGRDDFAAATDAAA